MYLSAYRTYEQFDVIKRVPKICFYQVQHTNKLHKDKLSQNKLSQIKNNLKEWA